MKKIYLFMTVAALFTASAVLAAPAELPKTGQTTSHLTGDDGELQKGVAWPEPRFTAGTGNEAACVIDTLTGLMWVKSPNSTARMWAEAITDANDLSLCGYDDWRLPNVNELESLVNAEEAYTAIWLMGKGFTNLTEYWYWTSSTYAGNAAEAWVVNMSDGAVNESGKTSGYYVLPVRFLQ